MIRNVVAAALLALAVSSAAQAEAWDYPEAKFGNFNPVQYSFTATGTGMLTAFFMPSTGTYKSALGVLVNGVEVGRSVLPLGKVANFTPYDFGTVRQGDTIEFFIDVYDRGTYLDSYASNVAYNGDGKQHLWTAEHPDQWYLGPRGVPTGIFFGFEDTLESDVRHDNNYRDYTFVVPNLTRTVFTGPVTPRPDVLSAPAVPEPASWAMLTAGFGLMGAAIRRRRRPAALA